MDNSFRIEFETPDLPELTRNNTVVDLHFHSRHSDGANTIPEIADQARALGIGVAMTDHNDIQGAVEMDAYPDVLSIPGIEVTAREGSHLLIYFYRLADLEKFYLWDIAPHMGSDLMSSIDLEMEEIIRRARRFETVIIFPHPYSAAYTGVCNLQFSMERRSELFAMVDGVEGINSENLKKWNLQCAVLGLNLSKAITGGSDGHTLHQLGKVVNFAPCAPTRRAFLDAVKKGETRVIGKEGNLFCKVRSNGMKLKTSIKHYPDLMGKNLRYGCIMIHSKSREIKNAINGTIRAFQNR